MTTGTPKEPDRSQPDSLSAVAPTPEEERVQTIYEPKGTDQPNPRR